MTERIEIQYGGDIKQLSVTEKSSREIDRNEIERKGEIERDREIKGKKGLI